MQKLKKICPILVLALLIISGSLYAFHSVYASAGFAKISDTNWRNIKNEMQNNMETTYPYDSPTASITSVSLDILYGTTRNLVTYHGEVPERETRNDDGKCVDEFEGIYARGGTSLSSDTKNKPNPGKVSAYDYWGFDEKDSSILPLDGSGNATLNDMQNVNNKKVISLRLYALSNTDKGILNGIVYSIGKFLCNAATLIINLIIIAKNIDMSDIMNLLNLQNMENMLTKNFIWDGEHLKLSAFTAFCIIMFIFAIVAYAVRYATGGSKNESMLNIVCTAAIGLLIIGMCLSGRIYTLGSSISDIASRLMYATAGSLNADGDGKTFDTQITDSQYTNKVIQLQEMSMINKAFIKQQICVQFGVSDIDQLKMTTLGDDANYKIANSALAGLNGCNIQDNFNGNLGYYFWFADSSAVKKTNLNTTYPETNTVSAQKKLNSMITYLQMLYNKARTDDNTTNQESIKNIILSLANPSGASFILTTILFIGIMVLLAIVLFKYALQAMIGKIELFVSLLGLTIAGPLMITTNKKLVNTGKTIMGMILVSFINITVYSIIFDVILYFIASMISTNLIQLILVLIILILLWKFNPIIYEKIKQLLERNERAISPVLADSKRAIKSYGRQKSEDFKNKYNNSEKIVDYDKETGKPIKQKREGDALSKIMALGHNAVFNEGMNHKSARKINQESNKRLEDHTAKTAREKRLIAENKVKAINENIKAEANYTANQVNEAQKDLAEQCYMRDIEGKVYSYNTDYLTNTEKDHMNKINTYESDIENIKGLEEYKKLCEEKAKIDAENLRRGENEPKLVFDKDKNDKLGSYNLMIQGNKINIQNERKALDESIKQRTTREAYNKYGLDYDKAEGSTDNEKLSNATRLKAQNAHEAELRQSLQTQINVVSEESNHTRTGKIGATEKTINREAIMSQATAEMQLSDLDNNRIISDRSEVQKDAQEIANFISKTDINIAKSDVNKAKDEVTNAKFIGDKKERKQQVEIRKQQVEERKKDLSETREKHSHYKKQVKEDNAKTISDQISTMVKQKELERDKAKSDLESRSSSSYTKKDYAASEVKNETTKL